MIQLTSYITIYDLVYCTCVSGFVDLGKEFCKTLQNLTLILFQKTNSCLSFEVKCYPKLRTETRFQNKKGDCFQKRFEFVRCIMYILIRLKVRFQIVIRKVSRLI